MTAPTIDPAPDGSGDDAGDAGEVRPARSNVARNSALVVGAVLVLFIAVLATRKPPEDVANPLVGRRMPELAGPTIHGDYLDVETLRGKWVLVNFLASWCVGCIEEHPDLIRFTETHGDTVQVVGVVYDNERPEELREFFRVRGGDWPVIVSERNAAYDFGVTGVPESFLVRSDGLIVAWAQGVTYDWLVQMMERYGEAAPTPAGAS